MKAVLETRFIGQAPDASGHPLAPPELVFQTSEPERVSLLDRFVRLSLAKKYALACAIGCTALVIRALVSVAESPMDVRSGLFIGALALWALAVLIFPARR